MAIKIMTCVEWGFEKERWSMKKHPNSCNWFEYDNGCWWHSCGMHTPSHLLILSIPTLPLITTECWVLSSSAIHLSLLIGFRGQKVLGLIKRPHLNVLYYALSKLWRCWPKKKFLFAHIMLWIIQFWLLCIKIIINTIS